MNCALIESHGDDIDKLLRIGQLPKPQRKRGELLVKVKAVALAPGDVRVMKGHCDFFQSPGTFPYIPGGDFCGIVEEADPTSRFRSGDGIVAMFELPRPLNALAEYCVVKESLAEIKPPDISWINAACLTSSAVAAFLAARHVTEGSRIMILGASGGVGTFLVQLCKNAKASFIAATSTDQVLVKSLGADVVIDYTQECWSDVPEFEDHPFDIIFDLGVGRKEAWVAAKNYSILKREGKFVTFSGHNPEMKIHNIWQTCAFMTALQGRVLGSGCWPLIPKYIWHNGLDLQPGMLKQLFGLVQAGKLKVVLDPISPLPFTADGIRKGFHLMNSRHAHGKVVVEVAPSL